MANDGQTLVQRIAATPGLSIGHDDHNRPTLVFTCRKCRATHAEIRHLSKNPAAAIKRAQRAGWSVRADGSHPICPACREKPVATVMSLPTNGALVGQIALIRLLDEHFDAKTGAYAAGYSDAKLAQLTSLKEDYVASIREAGFGKLVSPHLAAVAELRRHVESEFTSVDEMLKIMRDDFDKRLASLEAKVSGR